VNTTPHRGDRPAPTVLVLDDDAPLRRAAVRVLAKSGYRALGAASAAEALRLADDSPSGIDLLLCDLVLPGLSGREAANALMARRPGLKVLFTSGYSSYSSGRRDLDQPEWAFLSKPFNVEDLLGAVEAVLAGAPWPARAP